MIVFGNDGVLRVRAVVASDAKNAFTLTELAHAITRGAHDAGKILAEDERQCAVASIAYLPIHRVDPSRRDADKNFIRREAGLRKLSERPKVAAMFDHYSFHPITSLVRAQLRNLAGIPNYEPPIRVVASDSGSFPSPRPTKIELARDDARTLHGREKALRHALIKQRLWVYTNSRGPSFHFAAESTLGLRRKTSCR